MSDTAPETALLPVKVRAGSTRLSLIGSDRRPTSIEKAAMILTAIGPDLASGFLRQLSEEEIGRFAVAIGGLGKVGQETMDAVVVEFLDALTEGPEISGGAQAARKLLMSVMDESEIARLLGESGDRRTVWDRMNESPVAALATFLAAEHPLTAAVILSEMRAEVAASVLERLDQIFARSIVLRLSRVPTLDPAISARIHTALDREFLSELRRNRSTRRPADLIAGLMNNISTEAREGFLGYLESQDSALAQDVQRTMFTFDDIVVRIRGRDIPGILRDVPEEDLLKALKLGEMQQSPSVAFILENIPRRLSERYVEELTYLEALSRSEGEAAQIEITRVILSQIKAKTITIIEKDA